MSTIAVVGVGAVGGTVAARLCAVGLEGTHAEFGGQSEGLLIVDFGLLCIREITITIRRQSCEGIFAWILNSVVSISRIRSGMLGCVKCMLGAGARWCLISGGMCL